MLNYNTLCYLQCYKAILRRDRCDVLDSEPEILTGRLLDVNWLDSLIVVST